MPSRCSHAWRHSLHRPAHDHRIGCGSYPQTALDRAPTCCPCQPDWLRPTARARGRASRSPCEESRVRHRGEWPPGVAHDTQSSLQQARQRCSERATRSVSDEKDSLLSATPDQMSVVGRAGAEPMFTPWCAQPAASTSHPMTTTAVEPAGDARDAAATSISFPGSSSGKTLTLVLSLRFRRRRWHAVRSQHRSDLHV